jgi:hypothetical protein
MTTNTGRRGQSKRRCNDSYKVQKHTYCSCLSTVDTRFVIMFVSDRGGGIPRSKADRIFQYMYSTAPRPVSLMNAQHSGPVPLAGFGYGLPLVRLSLFDVHVNNENNVSIYRESTLCSIFQWRHGNTFHRWLRHQCICLSSSQSNERSRCNVYTHRSLSRQLTIVPANGCPYVIERPLNTTHHANINRIGRKNDEFRCIPMLLFLYLRACRECSCCFVQTWLVVFFFFLVDSHQ